MNLTILQVCLWPWLPSQTYRHGAALHHSYVKTPHVNYLMISVEYHSTKPCIAKSHVDELGTIQTSNMSTSHTIEQKFAQHHAAWIMSLLLAVCSLLSLTITIGMGAPTHALAPSPSQGAPAWAFQGKISFQHCCRPGIIAFDHTCQPLIYFLV